MNAVHNELVRILQIYSEEELAGAFVVVADRHRFKKPSQITQESKLPKQKPPYMYNLAMRSNDTVERRQIDLNDRRVDFSRRSNALFCRRSHFYQTLVPFSLNCSLRIKLDHNVNPKIADPANPSVVIKKCIFGEKSDIAPYR